MLTCEVRTLNNREKVRCVSAGLFYPKKVRENAFNKYLAKAGIPGHVANYYFDKKIGTGITERTTDLIARNIGFLFSGNLDYFSPGRFNTEDYPVLYTAREVQTAKLERFFYLREADIPFSYIVFSISASGKLADLRNFRDDSGRAIPELSHSECQKLARSLMSSSQESFSGIISSSARNIDGCCCTFFTIDGLQPGDLLEEGVYVN